MIRHVAMFTWSEAAEDGDIRAVAAGLAAMPSNVPGILRYEHGDDLQLGPGTADYVLVADFETVEDYRAYARHPFHREFVERHLEPAVGNVVRVQYHVS